jgi:hypothetical protein
MKNSLICIHNLLRSLHAALSTSDVEFIDDIVIRPLLHHFTYLADDVNINLKE